MQKDEFACNVADQNNGNRQVTSDTLRIIQYTNYYFVNEELIVQRMQYLSVPIPIDCKCINAKISFCGVRTDTLTIYYVTSVLFWLQLCGTRYIACRPT
jgi:hypothetical protein